MRVNVNPCDTAPGLIRASDRMYNTYYMFVFTVILYHRYLHDLNPFYSLIQWPQGGRDDDLKQCKLSTQLWIKLISIFVIGEWHITPLIQHRYRYCLGDFRQQGSSDAKLFKIHGAIPDSKVLGANMGPTWVLSDPDGPHVGPMNLVIRDMASLCPETTIHSLR